MPGRLVNTSAPSPSRCPSRIEGVIGFLLVASLAVGCTTPPSVGPDASTEPHETETWGEVNAQDIRYADRIGPLALAEIEDFDEPELGVRLKFTDSTQPHTSIDAYVYPIAKVKTASLAHVLEWEIESVTAQIKEVARRRGLFAAEPTSFPFGPSGEDSPIGLGVVLRLSSTSEDFMSYAFVAVRDHRFFKVRVTIPSDEILVGDDYVQDVVDMLFTAVRLRPDIEAPNFGITIYRNVFLAPQRESCNVAGWIAYGVEMKDQIQRGNYLNTFERELAARKRALDFWRENQHEREPCPSDVWEAMARAEEAGYLAEYVFTAYGRGRWPEPEGIDLQTWPDWANTYLEVHDPVLDPGVSVEWSEDQQERAAP